MNAQSAQAFSVWLLKEHPGLFYAVAKHVSPQLGGFSDILSNIGGAFTNAVSGVSDWVSNPDNVKSLTSLASTYFAAQAAQANAKTQLAVLNTQVQRAQAGQTPAPISYAYDANNQPVPVYTGTNALPGLGSPLMLPSGQPAYAMSSSSLNSLQPSFVQKYGMWLAVGGAAALLVFASLR